MRAPSFLFCFGVVCVGAHFFATTVNWRWRRRRSRVHASRGGGGGSGSQRPAAAAVAAAVGSSNEACGRRTSHTTFCYCDRLFAQPKSLEAKARIFAACARSGLRSLMRARAPALGFLDHRFRTTFSVRAFRHARARSCASEAAAAAATRMRILAVNSARARSLLSAQKPPRVAAVARCRRRASSSRIVVVAHRRRRRRQCRLQQIEYRASHQTTQRTKAMAARFRSAPSSALSSAAASVCKLRFLFLGQIERAFIFLLFFAGFSPPSCRTRIFCVASGAQTSPQSRRLSATTRRAAARARFAAGCASTH